MNTDDVYMKSIHVPIIIETDEDGIFIVSCPQFKGCHTYGKTIDEALVRIKEVIEPLHGGFAKLRTSEYFCGIPRG